MSIKLSLNILVFSLFSIVAFCQEYEGNFTRSEEDSIASVRRKDYENRVRSLAEMERRRAKDPKRYADSVARLREKRRFEQALVRMEDYKKSNLKELSEIDLTGARLTSIPAWVYEAVNLKVLVLDHNRISRLPKGLIAFDSLKRIYWRYNELGDSQPKLPKMRGVTKIDLTGNSLVKLPKVHRLKDLEELILEENDFVKIPIWRTRKLKKLKELDLSKNSLIVDKRWYGLLDHVEILKLNKCELQTLHPSLYRMSGLKELQVQVNKLSTVPAGISNLARLEKLSFYKNQLKELPDDFFELSRLRVIDLYYNEFEILPDEIGELKQLEILYASFNQLYDLPNSIEKLSKLEELYIHHNRISEIPGNLSELQSLRILHFQNTYLAEFPSQILTMERLEDLDISNTDIKRIPPELGILSLKNFYWRNLEIDLNDLNNIEIATTLLKMMQQGTNVVPKISTKEFAN